jgi:hypothetical protein
VDPLVVRAPPSYRASRRLAPPPSRYAAPGWTKVRSFGTYGKGRFRTGFLQPRRTTWYVARYSGGDFPAFTQVVKVEVRDH